LRLIGIKTAKKATGETSEKYFEMYFDCKLGEKDKVWGEENMLHLMFRGFGRPWVKKAKSLPNYGKNSRKYMRLS